MSEFKRRDFIKSVLAASAAAGLVGCSDEIKVTKETSTNAGAKSVMGLVVPAMERVRVAVIGIGNRGKGFVSRFCNIEGVDLVAVCDTHQPTLDRAQNILAKHGKPLAKIYTGDDYAYRKLLERGDIDIVVIATPWRWHTPMAIDVMESGKHAFVEVPAALTVEEAWQLVDTSERTQKNCMMMENVCYGREELMVLNMIGSGLLGDLLHGEAAYIHDLRPQMKHLEHGTGSWRTSWHTKRDGNLYPTHGLGPIAQYMNINRGDCFDYINSMSSPALGRAEYAREQFPADHQRNQLNYICGDMNTSMIKTKNGRSIMVQYDTTTPRPYTRHNLIQGTNGAFAGYPNRIALEDGGSKSFHEWDYDMEPWYEKFDHPLYSKMGKESEVNGGHGGKDFLMTWRFIYCLRNGEPLDQNVYDAAAWSVITPLSVDSVSDRGNAKEIPDFTRGKWKDTQRLGIVS